MTNLFLNLKKWTNLNQRNYLISNKTIVISSICLCVYLLIMDSILIHELKYQESLASVKFTSLNTLIPGSQNKSMKRFAPKVERDKTLFFPLPVKKVMMADTTMFIRSPLAEVVEKYFSFSSLFPFITANMISFTHNITIVLKLHFSM